MDLRVTDTAADGVHLISDGQTVMATVHRGGRELAQKMAAAPDLLEALENLTANLDHAFPALANLGPLKSARAAIAKAEGAAQ